MRGAWQTGSSNGKKIGTREDGFVLVAAMVVLLALTLFGIWAMRTSTLELDIAGSVQRAEKQFNVAEGAVALEIGNVGFAAVPWYIPNNLSVFNAPLIPPASATFDPAALDPAVPTTWPDGNLFGSAAAADNEVDYRCLVTYLYYDTAGKGDDAGGSADFYYRIQAQSAEGPAGSLVVEVGGTRNGVAP